MTILHLVYETLQATDAPGVDAVEAVEDAPRWLSLDRLDRLGFLGSALFYA